MRMTKRARVAASVLALALGAAACGGDDGGSGGGDSGSGFNPDAEVTGGTFSISINNPENPLLPANTTESEGNQVMSALFTGLVNYNVDTTEVEYTGVAEEITSEDNSLWTVKLKDGWTFQNGEPVDAESFVNAWNYGALSTNAQGGSYFFSNIVGYDEVQAETDDEGNITAPPAAQTMSGLKVVDPLTFTVELAEPFAQFPVTVGYTAFYPLPDAFYEDTEAFGRKPIGNGPFSAATEFVPDEGITLQKFADYAGEAEAKADTVEVRVISDINTAYAEVQGNNVDVLDVIPAEAITSAPDEFGDRFLERESSSFQYMGFPTYDPRFEDKRVRQAFSMAIDREAITETIFNGTRAPAFSVVSPVVNGSRDDACEYCKYDPEAAKALLEETGFDTSQNVDLWFNAGGGHDEWVTAVGNQLRQNLGINYTLQGQLDFAEYLPKGDAKGFTGPFRLGWSMDYPSPQNYLEPLYSTSALAPAGSNQTFYSNPEFDDLVSQGNQAENDEEAIELYQQAEDVLLEDMPILPMFFGRVQAVHSENVDNVVVDAFGTINLAGITVTS